MKWIKISLICLLTSCATQEEIERRELLKRLNSEMIGQQKIVKGLLLATQRIEKSLGTVSGKIEENEYEETITLESKVNEISQQISEVKELQSLSSKKIAKNQEDIGKIASEVNQQKKYIKKVLNVISNIDKAEKVTRAEESISFKNAIYLYQNKKYQKAMSQFSELLENQKKYKIKNKDIPRIYHNLGIIFFIRKDFERSQVYLSKLFTEFPDSGLNSSGLYHLGLSFKELKNKSMMTQTFKLLKEKFPNSRYTKKSKKFL